MTEFNAIIEKGEDGYLLSEVVGLPGCHSQAKTFDELIKRTKEAIQLYLDVEKDNTGNFESYPQVNFLGIQKIEI